ncbi:hypothetical protein DPEC_G00143570 [Dallia pectoralis]|uniref:Uncharacterized protein n=1 Tax=Dallia pectoralis TaxID=75939 RepID=A0ACC2GNC1_DALPE|nr:hypothetical protein DPEC_G00143570 [Dallia pectoralis]
MRFSKNIATTNLARLDCNLKWREHAFETDLDLEHHRFKFLPVMNNRASDINSLEMKPTLFQLHSEMKSFEHHFAWLSRASRKHNPLPRVDALIKDIKSLIQNLERQMIKVDPERLHNHVPVPSLPPHLPSQWDVLQSSQELLVQLYGLAQRVSVPHHNIIYDKFMILES